MIFAQTEWITEQTQIYLLHIYSLIHLDNEDYLKVIFMQIVGICTNITYQIQISAEKYLIRVIFVQIEGIMEQINVFIAHDSSFQYSQKQCI